MFGRAIDADLASPDQAAAPPDTAGLTRRLGQGHPSGLHNRSVNFRNLTNLGLAARLDAFRRGNARAVLDAQRAEMQQLSERAAELEKAAERFRRAGDEESAAAFAEQATALRRAGA